MFDLPRRIRDHVHHLQAGNCAPTIADRLAWDRGHLPQNRVPVVLTETAIPSTATKDICNLEPELYGLSIGGDLNVEWNRAGLGSRIAPSGDRTLVKLLPRVEPDEGPDLPHRDSQLLRTALWEPDGIVVYGKCPSWLNITAARLRPVATKTEPCVQPHLRCHRFRYASRRLT